MTKKRRRKTFDSWWITSVKKQRNRKDFDVNTDAFFYFFDNNFRTIPNKKKKNELIIFQIFATKKEIKKSLKITQEMKLKNKSKKYKKRKK